MFTVKENTTLVGVSELRSGIDKILEKPVTVPLLLRKGISPKLC
jgi:hypothetical protein